LNLGYPSRTADAATLAVDIAQRIAAREQPGPLDFVTRVNSTKVEGMRDFLVVPHWHPMLMISKTVIAQTVRFLESGRFDS
jgi:hypothetical protein